MSDKDSLPWFQFQKDRPFWSIQEIIRAGRTYGPAAENRQTVAVPIDAKRKVNVLVQLPPGWKRNAGRLEPSPRRRQDGKLGVARRNHQPDLPRRTDLRQRVRKFRSVTAWQDDRPIGFEQRGVVGAQVSGKHPAAPRMARRAEGSNQQDLRRSAQDQDVHGRPAAGPFAGRA